MLLFIIFIVDNVAITSLFCNITFLFFSEPEPQILDYVTQQHKLFIAIASTHAIRANAQWLWNLYEKVNKDLEIGKFDDLPEVCTQSCFRLITSEIKDGNLYHFEDSGLTKWP